MSTRRARRIPSQTTRLSTPAPAAATSLRFNPARHYVGLGTRAGQPLPAHTTLPSARTSADSAAVPRTTPSNGSASPHPRPSPPTADPTPADVDAFLRSIPTPLRLPQHDEILNRVTTPYDADAFESMLAKHNLTARYPDLVRNLRHGFPMGDFPDLEKTVIFPNHSSVAQHSAFVQNYLDEEILARRMSGPFTQEEVETILGGHFQCSPMIVSVSVQGPDLPDKLRLCRHLSKGDKQTLSTNAYIDKEKYPTKFGSAAHVAEIVSAFLSAPPRVRTCAARRERVASFLVYSYTHTRSTDTRTHIRAHGARRVHVFVHRILITAFRRSRMHRRARKPWFWTSRNSTVRARSSQHTRRCLC
jgi:hypothetical protein